MSWFRCGIIARVELCNNTWCLLSIEIHRLQIYTFSEQRHKYKLTTDTNLRLAFDDSGLDHIVWISDFKTYLYLRHKFYTTLGNYWSIFRSIIDNVWKDNFLTFYNCLYDDLWQREHTFMPSCVQCTFLDTRLDKIGEIHWCIHENFESTFLCFIISFCTFDFCDEFFVSTTHFKCTGFYFLMHTILVFSTPMISCDHDFFNVTIGLGLS